MSWQPYLTDVHTGLLGAPIDIPSFSWSMDVNDSSLSTTKSKKVGLDQVQNVTVPWDTIPGGTPRERYEAIQEGRVGLCLMWERDGKRTPILWGAIGGREDSYESASFTAESVYALLGDRVLCREGAFKDGTSTDTIAFTGMSMRGIASEVGYLCTNGKPGGELPVDWQYRGEAHQRRSGEDPTIHTRTYEAWNVGNQTGKQVLDKLAHVIDGVDMTFRPYLADSQHVRLLFTAGTDGDLYLGQDVMHSFTSFQGGGTLENVKVTYRGPVQRVYATGAGQDQATLTTLAQDLTLVSTSNPMALRESTLSDTDATNLDLLRKAAADALTARLAPIMQIQADYWCDDENTPDMGDMWPGDLVRLHLTDYPTLPDGVYTLRVMQMSGDATSKIHLLFDVAPIPYYEEA